MAEIIRVDQSAGPTGDGMGEPTTSANGDRMDEASTSPTGGGIRSVISVPDNKTKRKPAGKTTPKPASKSVVKKAEETIGETATKTTGKTASQPMGEPAFRIKPGEVSVEPIEADTPFDPSPVLKRNWLLFLVTAAYVEAALILIMSLLPARMSATTRIRVVGTEMTSAFSGRVTGTSGEEELLILRGELAGPDILSEAQSRAGAPGALAAVTLTTPRETPFIDIRVTSDNGEEAIRIANEIPGVLLERRESGSKDTTVSVIVRLQADAAKALDQAATIEADLVRLAGRGTPEQIFKLSAERDSLQALHDNLLQRAAEIEIDLSLWQVGFQVAVPAERAERIFPPAGLQSISLSVIGGLFVAGGVVMAREVRRRSRTDQDTPDTPGWIRKIRAMRTGSRGP